MSSEVDAIEMGGFTQRGSGTRRDSGTDYEVQENEPSGRFEKSGQGMKSMLSMLDKAKDQASPRLSLSNQGLLQAGFGDIPTWGYIAAGGALLAWALLARSKPKSEKQ